MPATKPKPKPKRVIPARTASSKGLDFIARWEGCVLHPYNDPAGYATIGVGHLLHRSHVTSADLEHYRGFTRPQALALLRQDVGNAVRGVNALRLTLNQHEFDALTSFAFNCGSGALIGGIARELHAGDKKGAMHVLQEYVHAGGIVLKGLVSRRAAEAHLFLNGIY